MLRFLLTAVALALVTGARAVPWSPGCMKYPYVSPAPGLKSSPVLNSIAVSDAFDLASIGIDALSLTTSHLGALKITLSASDVNAGVTPATVVLKDIRDGGQATALNSISFMDDVMQPFPDGPQGFLMAGDPEASISGSFYPAQDLQMLALGSSTEAGMGGSKGTWILRIVDLSKAGIGGSIDLQSWTLVLCPIVSASSGKADANADEPVVPAEETGSKTMTETINASTPIPPGALVTTAAVESATSSESAGVVLGLLNRIDRVMPGNGTLASNLLDYTPGSLLTNTQSVLMSNETVFDRIQERLDALLGITESDNITAPTSESDANSTLFGTFRLGSSELPKGPTIRVLEALQTLMEDVSEGDANASSLMVAAASGRVDSPVLSSPLLSNVGSLMSGSGYMSSVINTLSRLDNKLSDLPIVKTVSGQVANAAATTSSLLSTARDYSSKQVQESVGLLQSQSDLIQQALKSRITNYNSALTGTSSLISKAITKYSDQMVAQAKSIKDTATGIQTRVTKQSSDAATGILAQLSRMLQSSTGITQVASNLKGDLNGLVSTLMDVYKAQLDSVTNILSASSNAVVSQAQFRAESSIDSLNNVLTTISGALDKLGTRTGPLVDKSLEPYKQGLDFLQASLQGLKTAITTVPEITFGQLSGAGSGALLQNFYASLGIGTRSSKVISLLGNIDGLSSRLNALFPAAAQATAATRDASGR